MDMIDVTNRYMAIGVSLVMILMAGLLLLLCHHKKRVTPSSSSSLDELY